MRKIIIILLLFTILGASIYKRKIREGLKNPFAKMFKPLTEFIATIKNGIKKLGTGITKIFNGVENIAKKIECGFKKIGTLKACFLYYILDMFLSIIYIIFISLPIYVVKMITGVDLNSYLKLMLKPINMLDDFLHKKTGYHIIHFPDSIIKKCYKC
jgi:hypothetical protein